jgi:UDP-N-acetylglucosamine:LPS N-acetylglucosamine transferase
MKTLLVCSSGGHLSRLFALRPWWARHDRRWVSFRKPDVESLLVGETVAWAAHPVTRNLPNALRNLGLAWKTLRDYRPDVVISSGAGVAVPFFAVARLLRIPTVYLEAYERVETASLAGKLCYPMTDLFLLQWEEQRRNFPRGVLVGQLL